MDSHTSLCLHGHPKQTETEQWNRADVVVKNLVRTAVPCWQLYCPDNNNDGDDDDDDV